MLNSKFAPATGFLLALLAVPALAQTPVAPKVTVSRVTLAQASSAPATSTATLQVSAASVARPVESKKATSLKVTAGVTGKSMEDRWVNSKWAGGQLGLMGKREFFENMSGALDISFLMAAGTYSNQYGSEGSAPNAFWLDEASLAWTPVKFLKLEGGVIPMSFSSAPSNMDAHGFPSLRQSLLWERKSFTASLFAAQAIPASGTGSVKPSENGITTTYMTVGASVESSEKRSSPLSLNASILRYDFRNLNSSAATDSQFLGNSVVGSPGPQARFKYGFGGYEAAGGMKLRLGSRWSTRASGAFIRNELAPNNTNRGYQYTGGFGYKFGERELTLTGGYFHNQSDTIPGAYASLSRGYNNRFGNVARIALSDKKESISGFVQYVRSNEIEDRPYTADRDTVTFGLEAAYDVL